MISFLQPRRSRHIPASILHGIDETIFEILPERVLANLRSPNSENALVWNILYPLAQPTIKFSRLTQIHPLWGTIDSELERDDDLVPYFWGFNVDGERLIYLDETLSLLDDIGPQTEVDLFLLGRQNLVLVEAKNLGLLGRCSRFGRERCPEVHRSEGQREAFCRYWEVPDAQFASVLDFGDRPGEGEPSPPCNRHYQLGRTLLVGHTLGRRLNRSVHLWLFLPRNRWPSLERSWLDFAERILDDASWRRLRVLAWEDIID